jgi:predicted P-loop ATPase
VADLLTQRATWFADLVDAGFPLMALLPGTKKSVLASWQHLKPNPMLDPDDIEDNYGVVLGHHILVIDVDAKKFDGTRNPYQELLADLGLPEGFDTYTVRSRSNPDGQDSLHVYLRKPDHVRVRKHLADRYTKALEFLSFGCYVVGPGSLNPDNHDQPYEVINGHPNQLADAPLELLAMLMPEAPRLTIGAQEKVDRVVGAESNKKRFLDVLATHPGAVHGQRGDETTYQLAVKARDFGVTPQDTYAMMLEQWNHKCNPPWTPEALQAKVLGAFKYSKASFGNSAPPEAFEGPLPETPEIPETLAVKTKWASDKAYAESIAKVMWDYKPKLVSISDGNNGFVAAKQHILDDTLNNVKGTFRVPSYGEYYNALYGLVRYNRFVERLEFCKPAPWHVEGPQKLYWSSSDTSSLRSYYSEFMKWNPKEEIVHTGVHEYGKDNGFDPIKDYAKGNKWDGTLRLSGLFGHYASAGRTPYTDAVSRCFLIGAIARAMNPGAKVDYMPILEGAQGLKKSEFCKILGGDYHGEVRLGLDSHKDMVSAMQLIWIGEISEMPHVRRNDVENIKAMVTTTRDIARMPYARLAEHFPRRSVFIGTMNPEGDNKYFRDQTGNRRFWPITVGEILTDELIRDRDQLFAEAYHAWESGEPWWITDPVVAKMAEEEQSRRTESEAWSDIIRSWLSRNTSQMFLSNDAIISSILGIQARHINSGTSKRVHSAMREVGWRKCRRLVDGVYQHGFAPERLEWSDDIFDGV